MTEREQLLAESDTVVFRPSGPSRWIALVLGVTGMVAGAALLGEEPILAICIMAFCGLITLAVIPQFWPGAVYLKTTPNGFEVRNVRQHFFVPWADVEEFYVRRVGKQKYVAFRLAESSSLKQERSAATRWLVPDEIDGILPGTYGGFTLEELASRLNLWRWNALHLDTEEPHRFRQDGTDV